MKVKMSTLFLKYGLLPILLTALSSAAALKPVPYSPSLVPGSLCIVEVQSLHPTQFAVGYQEIEQRSKKVIKKNSEGLEKYLQKHIGKIVVSPDGKPYLIDRHHLACIMARTGRSTVIYATVEANFSGKTSDDFWKEMISRKWTYLYDENGKGPLSPHSLPATIKDLKDDPYRSLAWEVRERGGFSESDEPFSEFQWANYFRKKIKLNPDSNMDQIIGKAITLSHAPEAHALPGYLKSGEIQKTGSNQD
jgi:hypothetical protein